MQKTKTILIDDEKHALDLIEILLTDYPFIEVIDKCSNGEDAINSIIEKRPDLIFLDINLGTTNGFQIIEELQALESVPDVIFISAHNKALKAYEYSAFDYIMKPIDPDRLRKSVLRYRNHQLRINKTPKRLKFITQNGIIFIDERQLIACKAEGNYTSLLLTNHKQETVTIQLGHLQNQLSSQFFFRSHRSVLINVKYLQCIRKDSVLLSDDNIEYTFPLSKENRKELELIASEFNPVEGL